MSSEFEELMEEGFAEAMAVIGSTNIRCGQVTKGCIAAPFKMTREQRDSGFWQEITTTVEVSRADFLELKIADRSTVTVGGRKMTVRTFEEDPHDPTARIFLKPA
jgi:hypothetical protein